MLKLFLEQFLILSYHKTNKIVDITDLKQKKYIYQLGYKSKFSVSLAVIWA